MERCNVWWPMEGEGKTHFHLFPLSPQQTLLKPSIFSFDLKVLLYHGLGRYSRLSFLFFNLYITIAHFNVTNPSHLHCRFDFD